MLLGVKTGVNASKIVRKLESMQGFGFPGAHPCHDSTKLTAGRQGEHWELKIQSDFGSIVLFKSFLRMA